MYMYMYMSMYIYIYRFNPTAVELVDPVIK